jgi:TRAP-type C4-dicarboxylate transport system permease small subunit
MKHFWTVGHWFVGLMAMIVLASTLGLVIDRHLIRSSFDAYDQISRLALVWMTFLGFFFALEEKANIHVEILDVILPARLKPFRSVVFGAIMLFISTLLFFKGWEAVRAGAAQQILGTPFSYAWSFSAIPVSMGLIVVFRVTKIIRLRREVRHLPDGEGARPC